MFEKDRWEGIKTFFDAIRTPTIAIIIVILLLFPGIITYFISHAGFRVDAVEFAGVKLAAKTSSADLEATAAKLKQVTLALADSDKLLGDIAQQATDPNTKARITEEMQSWRNLIQNSQDVAKVASAQATETQTTLQALSPPTVPIGVPGASLFVFGADHDELPALDEIRNARRLLTGSEATLALFRKGNFYRSVAIFPSDASRSRSVGTIERGLNRTGQAVSLLTWCPGASRLPDAVSADGKVTAPVYQC